MAALLRPSNHHREISAQENRPRSRRKAGPHEPSLAPNIATVEIVKCFGEWPQSRSPDWLCFQGHSPPPNSLKAASKSLLGRQTGLLPTTQRKLLGGISPAQSPAIRKTDSSLSLAAPSEFAEENFPPRDQGRVVLNFTLCSATRCATERLSGRDVPRA